MDNNELLSVSKYIQEELRKKCLTSSLQHNHPPLRFIVNNCEYCKRFGNVFVTNISNLV